MGRTTSALEGKIISTIQTETQEEKTAANKQSLSHLWDYITLFNRHIVGVPEKRREKPRTRKHI